MIVRLFVGPIPLQPFESVALTVIGKLPVCVGVPERTPAADNVMPAGSVPLTRTGEERQTEMASTSVAASRPRP